MKRSCRSDNACPVPGTMNTMRSGGTRQARTLHRPSNRSAMAPLSSAFYVTGPRGLCQHAF